VGGAERGRRGAEGRAWGPGKDRWGSCDGGLGQAEGSSTRAPSLSVQYPTPQLPWWGRSSALRRGFVCSWRQPHHASQRGEPGATRHTSSVVFSGETTEKGSWGKGSGSGYGDGRRTTVQVFVQTLTLKTGGPWTQGDLNCCSVNDIRHYVARSDINKRSTLKGIGIEILLVSILLTWRWAPWRRFPGHNSPLILRHLQLKGERAMARKGTEPHCFSASPLQHLLPQSSRSVLCSSSVGKSKQCTICSHEPYAGASSRS